ncbi:MAG: hypothetical protein WAS05_08990 [Candidatus Nanopelagicales bacterium]
MSEQQTGKWDVSPDSGLIHLKTKRIGIFKVNATAPIVGGFLNWDSAEAELEVKMDINQINTGYPILDPQFKKLIASGSDGILVFDGKGEQGSSETSFTGKAQAGDVIVDMSIVGTQSADGQTLAVEGTATFTDVHIPIPGFSKLNTIDINVEGTLVLVQS